MLFLLLILQTRNVSQIIWNNNPGFQYNHDTIENDIVILKLDNALEFNNNGQPACLPDSADYLDTKSKEEQCFTSGWGALYANLVPPNEEGKSHKTNATYWNWNSFGFLKL